tara:strand:- start:560 stop:754 length:195 start_codon:yes stop_codon:yes gene_type:complete
MRFWEVFFMMKEKPKRRRRREEKFACKGEKPEKVGKREKHTHKDISPVHNLFIRPSALIYLWEG